MRLNIACLIMAALSLCVELSSAYFLPILKAAKGYASPYGYTNYGYGSGGGYGSYGSGSYGSSNYGHHSGGRRSAGKRTGRTYSDIARVVNPNPYAFISARNPYPGQPFNPQG